MITEALLAAAPTPVPLTVGGHTFRMVPVRGGEFDMGDEVGDLYDFCRPVHRVRLDDFWIGQFPVTQALWRAVALSDVAGGNHPVTTFNPDPSFFKGDHRPVEQVSWQEIRVFLNKLNLLLLSGWNFRLPTEAEWEYAARGGHHVTL
ncbi:MAG: formylglycine-generating enzyme family protein, partial [Saprospiraceae bacterium]|nr:formylglycine-generating enzyme family protein [Saprospiraceae bacterium]